MRFFKFTLRLFFLVLLVSCSTDKENINSIIEEIESEEKIEPPRSLTAIELEFIDEYEYVTFNLAPDSFGAAVNEKWVTDIKLFMSGPISSFYVDQVEIALSNFNQLFGEGTTIQLVSTIEESNIQLIFGDKDAIREIWPDMYEVIGDVNFSGYALYNRDGEFQITRGRIWVKNASIPLFAHELGHTIGLGHASNSLCTGNAETNQSFMCSFLRDDFSAFDKAIIQTLYNPKVEAGLNFTQLKPIIEELLRNEVVLVQ